MSFGKMLPLLALVAATLTACADTQDADLSSRPAAPADWVTPTTIHSTPEAGSVSDEASGSTVLDDQRR
jgi:hypothetical protein